MDRNATPAVLAELAASQSGPCHLVELHRDAGTTYLTDAYRSIVWGGNTYTAQGHLLEFGGLAETLDLQTHRISVMLAGDDENRTWVAAVLSEEWVGRRLVIRKAFLSASGSVIADPVAIFDGLIDDIDVGDELDPNKGSTRVTVHAMPEFSNFDHRPGRHTNDEQQQQFFPGDRFFQHASSQARVITWGGNRVSENYIRRTQERAARREPGDG